ncbi:hypothetical protein BN2476_1450004 [Paraburkholderia piptadeniae]|uniref:Uncharacterized protein n=1 Tax=Paraburkholderia piptadeniae TaxID=1701573 RepID=A0A1N7SWN0_9BURK|nr:hypothetical protein BN2476_1450004 [Paraburkholderia piptadeniae]
MSLPAKGRSRPVAGIRCRSASGRFPAVHGRSLGSRMLPRCQSLGFDQSPPSRRCRSLAAFAVVGATARSIFEVAPRRLWIGPIASLIGKSFYCHLFAFFFIRLMQERRKFAT